MQFTVSFNIHTLKIKKNVFIKLQCNNVSCYVSKEYHNSNINIKNGFKNTKLIALTTK